MRVLLLPRLKPFGVSLILEGLQASSPSSRNGIELLREHAALKTVASTGGVRADSAAVQITEELRNIAREVQSDTPSPQAARSLFDQRGAIFLAQKSPELKSGEALRDDVWAFMTTVLAADLVTWRFPAKTSLQVERFAGGVRNAFQRLWIRGVVLDRGEGNADRWGLVERLTEDALVQIFERASIAGNPPLAKALAEGWCRAAEKNSRGNMEDIMRSATKILRVRNQIIDLAYLSGEELDQVVSEAFEQAARKVSTGHD